jgi:hypothetical protein
MPRHEALKALEIYRRAGQQVAPKPGQLFCGVYLGSIKYGGDAFYSFLCCFVILYRLGAYLTSMKIAGV